MDDTDDKPTPAQRNARDRALTDGLTAIQSVYERWVTARDAPPALGAFFEEVRHALVKRLTN